MVAQALPHFDYLPFLKRILLQWKVWRVTRRHDKAIGVEIIPIRSVGVVGDGHSYEPTVFLRPPAGRVYSFECFGLLATDIVNKVPGVGRVLVDVTPSVQNRGSS